MFPLERNAAVRSRLTHSMEVQQVGRHIAKEILNRFKQAGRIDELGLTRLLDPFESIVEMACLMHDIGNPPFGHFGESAINDWFAQRLDPASCGSEPGSHDRCRWRRCACMRGERSEPAAQPDPSGSQPLRGQCPCDPHGVQPAQAQPDLRAGRLHFEIHPPGLLGERHPRQPQLPDEKPGYYLAEEAFVDRLRRELHMGEFDRFPLTYIMEAADDISYCVADLEDAVEKSIFTVEQLYQHLIQEWGEVVPGDLFDKTVASAFRKIDRGGARRSAEDQFFMYLRVFTVARLVPHAAQRFIDNLDAVYQGSFNQALLEDSSPAYRLLKIFKNVAFKHVFNHPEVEQLELQGYRVISGLLDIYSPLLAMSLADFSQLVREDSHRAYPIETRLFHKLSTKHRLAYAEAVEGCSIYRRSSKPFGNIISARVYCRTISVE